MPSRKLYLLRKPLLTRILDAAHKTTVFALIGGTCFLGYMIYRTVQGHKRAIRGALNFAEIRQTPEEVVNMTIKGSNN